MTEILKVTGGVDTHKDVHVVAALDEVGRLMGVSSFPVSKSGYAALLGWLRSHGEVVAVGVEGTGSWGAGLSRYLRGEMVTVIEVNRPNRQTRRRRGKSDPTDAEAAARAVLSREACGTPKAGDGPVEAIRILRLVRSSAMKARTQTMNQFHALIDTAPEPLRAELGSLATRDRLRRAAKFRPGTPTDPVATTKSALTILARRWLALTQEITDLDAQLRVLTTTTAPGLVNLHGISTGTGSALLVAAGDNPDRLRSERSFAALCGVSPLDASSGRQQRHRLNRGGDRQANCALHQIIIVRLRWDPATQAYMRRRLAEGKTKKEIIRCLKRHLVREVYTQIRHALLATQPAQKAA